MQLTSSNNRTAEVRHIVEASRRKNGDRIAQANDEVRAWKKGFWCVFALLIGAVGALAYAALQPRFIPYTVAVDQHGVAVPIGPAERTTPNDPNAIRAELTRFIGYVRTVSSDPYAQRAMVERAYAHVTPATAEVLNAYFRDPANDARIVAQRAVRLVRVLRVTPLPASGGNTWNLLWQETEIEHGSERRSTTSWEAYLTVGRATPSAIERRTAEQISLNPLGLYITDLSWSPIANVDSTQ